MILKKFLKFMLIGASGTIINLIIFSFLIFLDFDRFLSATLAFIFAVSNNFYFNFKWTFKGQAENKSIKTKYIQFFMISLVNFGFNLVFLNFFDNNLDFGFLLNYGISTENMLKIKTIFSQILAIGIASVLNFFGNYLITFKGEKNV